MYEDVLETDSKINYEDYISFQDEIWETLDDFPRYRVSTYGRIRYINSSKPMKPQINNKGFPVILLMRSDSKTRYLRHLNKLIAVKFLPTPRPDHTAIWHIDGNLENCKVTNLRWDFRRNVLEWNDMHRRGVPKYNTNMVRNTKTGVLYENAYECGIEEGYTETRVLEMAELQYYGYYNEINNYVWVPKDEKELYDPDFR